MGVHPGNDHRQSFPDNVTFDRTAYKPSIPPVDKGKSCPLSSSEAGPWTPTQRELRVASREGGTIVAVAPGGRELLWGTITTYAPPPAGHREACVTARA
jgi:hypothetical protein